MLRLILPLSVLLAGCSNSTPPTTAATAQTTETLAQKADTPVNPRVDSLTTDSGRSTMPVKPIDTGDSRMPVIEGTRPGVKPM